MIFTAAGPAPQANVMLWHLTSAFTGPGPARYVSAGNSGHVLSHSHGRRSSACRTVPRRHKRGTVHRAAVVWRLVGEVDGRGSFTALERRCLRSRARWSLMRAFPASRGHVGHWTVPLTGRVWGRAGRGYPVVRETAASRPLCSRGAVTVQPDSLYSLTTPNCASLHQPVITPLCRDRGQAPVRHGQVAMQVAWRMTSTGSSVPVSVP
jgi:hypothetical protein